MVEEHYGSMHKSKNHTPGKMIKAIHITDCCYGSEKFNGLMPVDGLWPQEGSAVFAMYLTDRSNRDYH